jgi:energy-coupling factor transporter transmembrane protein EcfT
MTHPLRYEVNCSVLFTELPLLARPAAAADRIGAVVLVEPVSGAERYPLHAAADAVAVLDRVGADNVALLADLYHLTVNGDDLDAVVGRYADRVGHVQIADAPGRHEPGTGRIDLDRHLAALAAAGYDGLGRVRVYAGHDQRRRLRLAAPRAPRRPSTGLVLVPVAQDYFAGDMTLFDGDLDFGLRLGFAWSAALFVSISLFSTMSIDHLTDGLRGLWVFEKACFLVGYAFLLMCASLADIFRTVDAMRLKGIEMRLGKPLQAIGNMARLMVPAIITMARRSSTMMSVLQLRGFSFTQHRQTTTLAALRAADVTLLAAGLAIGAVAIAARAGLLPAIA